jgi:hypothetical protein
VVKGPNPPHHYTTMLPNRRCICELYRRACISPATPSCGIGAGGAFESPSGYRVQQQLGGAAGTWDLGGAEEHGPHARRAGAPRPAVEKTARRPQSGRVHRRGGWGGGRAPGSRQEITPTPTRGPGLAVDTKWLITAHGCGY